MRPLRALALAVVAVALLTGAARGPAASVPRIPAVAEKAGPLLGIAFRSEVGTLARLDPRSLQARKGVRLLLGRGITGWGFSADRTRLVVCRETRSLAVLRFVDASTLKPLGRLVLGAGWVQKVAWVAPDRLLVLQVHDGSNELVVVDPQALRVVVREAVPGDLVAIERAADRLVLLLAPHGRIGVATLAVASPNGSLTTVSLDRTYAGFEGSPDGGPETPIAHHRTPGLAIDPDARRAIVVGAGEPAAEVLLDSLAVSYHSLTRASLLSRLGRWLEPDALAKGSDGPSRYASWLGNGLVAVAGSDERLYESASGRQESSTPSGLQLLDTSTWSVRTLAPGADSFTRAGAWLLATGTRWSSETQEQRTIGLAGFGPDGALRFRTLKRQNVYVDFVYRGRAYVEAESSGGVIVDARSGRTVGRHAGLPWLLLGDAS
jgi:hypothetical protein